MGESTIADGCDWRIRVTVDAKDAACDKVLEWLREFNLSKNFEYTSKVQRGEAEERHLIVLAYHDDELVGGLIGATRLAWLKIFKLAVRPAYRGRGVGLRLIAEAERQAQGRDCRYAFVDTICFQAPDFYAKAGFHMAGHLPDWDSHGHTMFCFIKELGTANPSRHNE
jgi:GNAT superfamily N-acetyltransferase